MGNKNTHVKLISKICHKLARKIETSSIKFDKYINECSITQPECPITINELKDVFFSLKTNKSPGYDEISFNIIKNCFGVLYKPLLYIFNLSIEKGIFPNDLKIARVTPIFKADSEEVLANYRPISVLPCFSKCA